MFVERNKSFGQAFSKACGFLRQSLKPLSADSGTLLTKRSFEGLKGNFSHEEKFPLTVFIVLLYLRKYSGEIFAEAVSLYRKKLIARAKRPECACKRAAERSDTFCGEEKQWSGWLIFYRVKNRNKRNLFRRERVELVLTRVWLFAICIIVPQMCHRHIWGGKIFFCIQFKGNFFREKVSLIPFKNRFVKSVPLSADSGLRLCLKNPPPFVKGGRKLLLCSP